MLLRDSFYCLTDSAISNLNHYSCFKQPSNTKQLSEILILKIEMLLEFQNNTNFEIIGF